MSEVLDNEFKVEWYTAVGDLGTEITLNEVLDHGKLIESGVGMVTEYSIYEYRGLHICINTTIITFITIMRGNKIIGAHPLYRLGKILAQGGGGQN